MKYATPSSQRIKLNLWVTSSISNQTPLTANVFCSSEFEGFFSRWSNIKVALWVWLVCLEAAAVLTCGINLSFYGHTSATTEGLSLVQTFPQDGQPKYVFTPFLNILLPSRRTALLLVAGVCKSVILCMKCLNSLCCSKRPVPNKPTLKKVAQLCNSLSFVNFWLLEGGVLAEAPGGAITILKEELNLWLLLHYHRHLMQTETQKKPNCEGAVLFFFTQEEPSYDLMLAVNNLNE